MNDHSSAARPFSPWKILIADDDRDVHEATRLALRGIQFRGRALEFIDAYSGTQTLAVLQEHPDTAIVFLDVIMESEDAGLAAARRIRENGFKLVRIIVRTGFPGQAPERQVIVDYDIHDYKEKSGLSVQKLFTSVISALRAYADLVALESHRRGLMSVLESVSWFDFLAVRNYVAGMLAEFSDLARLGSGRIVMIARSSAKPEEQPVIVASLGDWREPGEPLGVDDLSAETHALVRNSFGQMQAVSGEDGGTWFVRNHGIDLVVFAAGKDALAQADEVLLEVFLGKVCQAIGSQRAYANIESDRDAVLRGLALRAERWNDHAAVELERLSRLTCAIATRLNTTLVFPEEIDRHFVRVIGIAAMLHDLGNDSIAAVLLAKRSDYDPQERASMQAHVGAGGDALKYFLVGTGDSLVLNLAHDIIAAHHERFDGAGYPRGLHGDAIPLAARLVSVADAYVAMTSPRPHRSPVESSVARAAIKSGAGGCYDPRVVEAFLQLLEGDFADAL